MRASATERRRVGDEGLRVVNRFGPEVRQSNLLEQPEKQARAKFVPAAAVRRTVRTLFGITGLKGRVGGQSSQG